MNILYAVQGTGNGHVARARHLLPLIAQHVNVEVWVSGTESQLNLSGVRVRRFSGISLKYHRHGGVSYVQTLFRNPWLRFVIDVAMAPVRDFDLIVNDFEPVSAWAVVLKGGNLVEVSHQAGVRHPLAPRPAKGDVLGAWVLRNYAPSKRQIGFHVQAIPPDVYPPLIRREIRIAAQAPVPKLVVYLPAYGVDELVRHLSPSPVPVHAFSSRVTEVVEVGRVRIEPISAEGFIQAFCTADSVLCSAGFELPTEALFHGKRTAVIPIAGQYEQACNATALRKAGAWYASTLANLKLVKWLKSPPPNATYWPDCSDEVVQRILSCARPEGSNSQAPQARTSSSLHKNGKAMRI